MGDVIRRDGDAHKGEIGLEERTWSAIEQALPAGEVVLQEDQGVSRGGGQGLYFDMGRRKGDEGGEGGGSGGLEYKGAVNEAIGQGGVKIIFCLLEENGIVAHDGCAGLFGIVGPLAEDLFETGPIVFCDGFEGWKGDTRCDMGQEGLHGGRALTLDAGDG